MKAASDGAARLPAGAMAASCKRRRVTGQMRSGQSHRLFVKAARIEQVSHYAAGLAMGLEFTLPVPSCESAPASAVRGVGADHRQNASATRIGNTLQQYPSAIPFSHTNRRPNQRPNRTRAWMKYHPSPCLYWSGRRDSNSRPLAPHASALPGCATPRKNESISEKTGPCPTLSAPVCRFRRRY